MIKKITLITALAVLAISLPALAMTEEGEGDPGHPKTKLVKQSAPDQKDLSAAGHSEGSAKREVKLSESARASGKEPSEEDLEAILAAKKADNRREELLAKIAEEDKKAADLQKAKVTAEVARLKTLGYHSIENQGHTYAFKLTLASGTTRTVFHGKIKGDDCVAEYDIFNLTGRRVGEDADRDLLFPHYKAELGKYVTKVKGGRKAGGIASTANYPSMEAFYRDHLLIGPANFM